MKRTFKAVLIAVAALWAVPAFAQTSGAAQPPLFDGRYLGVNLGVSVVEKASGTVGLDGGWQFMKNLDVIGEVFWAQNVVTRKQLDSASNLATHIGQTQNGSASGSAKMSALYGGLGVRWVFDREAKFKPYALVTVGGARMSVKPKFELNGSDISGSLPQYGVTLGKDLDGTSASFAATFGGGIVMDWKAYYIEGGVRLTRFNRPEQAANAARLIVGFGYRF